MVNIKSLNVLHYLPGFIDWLPSSNFAKNLPTENGLENNNLMHKIRWECVSVCTSMFLCTPSVHTKIHWGLGISTRLPRPARPYSLNLLILSDNTNTETPSLLLLSRPSNTNIEAASTSGLWISRYPPLYRYRVSRIQRPQCIGLIYPVADLQMFG